MEKARMAAWINVYRKLDPSEPLASKDRRLERGLYVGGFIESIREKLVINKNKNYKLLLSGHTGCGKSTFLNILASDPAIRRAYHVVKFSVKDLLDVNDLDHIDLLLAMAGQAFASLPEDRPDESLLKKARRLAGELQGQIEAEDETTDSRQGELGGEVGLGFDLFGYFKEKLFARFRFEHQTRTKIRTHYQPRISEFIRKIDGILLDTARLAKKPLLILVDDTDKLPPESGLAIFFDNGHHFSTLNAALLLVLDISLSNSAKFPAIRAKFSEGEFFPAVKVFDRDGNVRGPGVDDYRAIIRELVLKRIPASLIEPDALEEAITLSGGVTRELVRLLNHAIFKARGKIDLPAVQYAGVRIANDYNLTGKHTQIMMKVLANPDWLASNSDVDEATRIELLHMPALFEYRNGENKWYRPYPVFNTYLKRIYPDFDPHALVAAG